MIQLIESQWTAFEGAKKDFLAHLSAWSEEQLMFSPDGGWNAIKVVEHIIASETGTLEYIRRKTQAPPLELESTGEREAAAAHLLFSALRSQERWSAPEILPDPLGKFSLAQLQYGWNSNRTLWANTLQAMDPEYLNKAVFKHPRAGRMGMRETLEFLTLHIVHHRYQIDRIAEQYQVNS
jgi:hypothetical protein